MPAYSCPDCDGFGVQDCSACHGLGDGCTAPDCEDGAVECETCAGSGVSEVAP